jgi:hypothetical protein
MNHYFWNFSLNMFWPRMSTESLYFQKWKHRLMGNAVYLTSTIAPWGSEFLVLPIWIIATYLFLNANLAFHTLFPK